MKKEKFRKFTAFFREIQDRGSNERVEAMARSDVIPFLLISGLKGVEHVE